MLDFRIPQLSNMLMIFLRVQGQVRWGQFSQSPQASLPPVIKEIPLGNSLRASPRTGP